MKFITLIILNIFIISSAFSQGPPITGDKAIMLGEGTLVVKTLIESLHTDQGSFTYAPLMIHYLPTSNSLVAIHLPYTSSPTESGLGDVVLRAKYQVYRNDMKARTHRIALKSVHWMPTGFETGIEDYGVGKYQSSFSIISGYETLKHGIGNEIGYRYVGGDNSDYWIVNAEFGLPLLKPTYPVNQLNLYFEYSSRWFNDGNKRILYSQGIQYARDQVTLDLAISLPLYESESLPIDINYKLLFGARYVW